MLQEQLAGDIEKQDQTVELQRAFNSFNQASSHLTEIYHNLERPSSSGRYGRSLTARVLSKLHAEIRRVKLKKRSI